MPRIKVKRTIDAPRKQVWAELADIPSHVEWMGDAEVIRFTGDKTKGIGTEFECDTKVGPLRTTDKMTITEWDKNRRMGVEHVGLVTGTGAFELKRKRGGRTQIIWREKLKYPLWLGGPVGGVVSKPILKRIWKKSLARLAARVEQP